MITMNWKVLRSVSFGRGSLALVAWKTKAGHHAYAGLIHTPEFCGGIPSFPRMVYGGQPSCWKQSRQILKKIQNMPELTQLQLSWVMKPFDHIEEFEDMIKSASTEAVGRWGEKLVLSILIKLLNISGALVLYVAFDNE